VTHPKNRKDFKRDYEIGSSNVYADLGRTAAGSLLIKAQLVSKISEILEEQGQTQIKAAALLGNDFAATIALIWLVAGEGQSPSRCFDCLESFPSSIPP
jgi:hypothetical protein